MQVVYFLLFLLLQKIHNLYLAYVNYNIFVNIIGHTYL
jgi:hypothetical protein